MAPKKYFLITLSSLLFFKFCVSSPVTLPNKTEIVEPEMPEIPETPEMPENLCALPPQLGHSG